MEYRHVGEQIEDGNRHGRIDDRAGLRHRQNFHGIHVQAVEIGARGHQVRGAHPLEQRQVAEDGGDQR